MTTLIVFLPPTADPGAASAEFAFVVTADGHAAVRQASAPAALLPHPGRAGETVAVVPARALSWQRVELPRGIKASQPVRLRAVLDGLLEERLLDDPQTLHFALAPGARPGAPAWVAVCDRLWLRSAIAALESAGRPVARIVPEFAPDDGPDPQKQIYAIGTPEDALLVATGERPGSAVTVLPLSPSALALVDAGPADAPVPLFAEPAVAALVENLAGHPAQLQTAATRWMAAARGPWDLAQFDRANSGRSRAVKRAGSLMGELLRAPQWRAARWGAAVLVVSSVVGLNAWAWKERSALDAQEAAIRGLLTTTFPAIRAVADAPIQMEREIALLRQATGAATGGDLETLLAATGAVLPAGRAATALDYSGSEVRLRGLDLTPDEVAGVSATLRAQGLTGRGDGDALVVRQGTTP